MGSEEVTAAAELVEGIACTLTVEFRVDSAEMPVAAVSFGGAFRPPDDALTVAADAARAADVALVVVGTDGRWETEGKDRSTLRLPGDQDALVSAVAAANPRTVVVVNSGAPVEMPWADEVPGIVQVWYPGQEGGTAIVDVLLGDVDASGRLPTTFPVRLEDTPAFRFYPGDGQTLHYGEGLMVGYRHYDTRGVDPRFCFGHGLSYTTFAYGEPRHRARWDRRCGRVRPCQHRTATGCRSSPGVRAPASFWPGTSGQGAEGVRKGVVGPRGEHSRASAPSRAVSPPLGRDGEPLGCRARGGRHPRRRLVARHSAFGHDDPRSLTRSIVLRCDIVTGPTLGEPKSSVEDQMEPIATTKQGKVRGSTEEGTAVFLGIPYAAPPVGDARFAPPAPPERWEATRDALTYGATALQPEQEFTLIP